MAKHLPTHLITTGYNMCLVVPTSTTIKTTDYNIYLVATTSTKNKATDGNNICQNITKLPKTTKVSIKLQDTPTL